MLKMMDFCAENDEFGSRLPLRVRGQHDVLPRVSERIHLQLLLGMGLCARILAAGTVLCE